MVKSKPHFAAIAIDDACSLSHRMNGFFRESIFLYWRIADLTFTAIGPQQHILCRICFQMMIDGDRIGFMDHIDLSAAFRDLSA